MIQNKKTVELEFTPLFIHPYMDMYIPEKNKTEAMEQIQFRIEQKTALVTIEAGLDLTISNLYDVVAFIDSVRTEKITQYCKLKFLDLYDKDKQDIVDLIIKNKDNFVCRWTYSAKLDDNKNIEEIIDVFTFFITMKPEGNKEKFKWYKRLL